MSEPSASVPDDDGSPPSDKAQSEEKSKKPPPVPSTRPSTKLNTNTEAIAKSNVPVENLINMDEDKSTSEAGSGLATESAGSSKDGEKVMTPIEALLYSFLESEEARPFSDFFNQYQDVRAEQDRLFKLPGYKTHVATSAPHYNRNRYRDILPYDHNRVALKDQFDNPHGYINASFINLPDSKIKFIAAQAPLPATLEEWWKMIDEQKIKLIVMLCKLVELSKVKCERYWPTEVGETEVYGDYEIKLEEERPYLEDDFVLRLISMKDQRTSETRNLWQLHYREWPDHGCPDGEKQLLNMLEVMETIHNEHSEGAPVLVHCSAGVGRTGTIIAINDIREKIKAETLQSIDIFRLVCFLRTQRSSMVQTPDQYWFVHKCICAYARRQLGMPEIERNDQTSLQAPVTGGGGVRLIPPPTPTTSGNQPGIAQQSQPDPTSAGQVVEDESNATSVPDFPGEPPAPLGPEDPDNSAAS